MIPLEPILIIIFYLKILSFLCGHDVIQYLEQRTLTVEGRITVKLSPDSLDWI